MRARVRRAARNRAGGELAVARLAGWLVVRTARNMGGNRHNRREVLCLGVLTALALPLAGCGEGYDDSPDPLAAMAAAARSDATAARKLGESADAKLAVAVAEVRAAHAEALTTEAARANRPPLEGKKLSSSVSDLAALGKRLREARKQALSLLAAEPRHRAGLLGSVAAGCASAQALDPALGKIGEAEFTPPTPAGELDEDAVAALQRALDTEHAAIWVCGLVAAFLPGSFSKGLDAATAEHRQRRDGAQIVIAAAGAKPNIAEPAYLPPEPVTSAESAKALVVSAEADAASAWRGVLERCDDKELRSFAAAALVSSAVRGTRWRAELGTSPAAIALPGTE